VARPLSVWHCGWGASDGFAGGQRSAGLAHDQDGCVRCPPGDEVERRLDLLAEHGVIATVTAVAANAIVDGLDGHQPRVRLKLKCVGRLSDQGSCRRAADRLVDRVPPEGRISFNEPLVDAAYRRVGPRRPGVPQGRHVLVAVAAGPELDPQEADASKTTPMAKAAPIRQRICISCPPENAEPEEARMLYVNGPGRGCSPASRVGANTSQAPERPSTGQVDGLPVPDRPVTRLRPLA
jgi:hypothetical protein